MLIQQTDLPILAALVVGAVISYLTKKLTFPAAVTGLFCATLIYFGTGYTGVICLAVFFTTGTLGTAWGKRRKLKFEKRGDDSQRKAGQVLANAGAATFFALLAILMPAYSTLFTVMLVASLSSATSDTLSSELGMLYGKRFYNCLSWKKEPAGLDGVVSLEGTFAGLIGAILIALVYAVSKQCDPAFFMIIISGMAGNFSDSLFGATLERKRLLNNDTVNFMSTLIAAALAGFILYVYQLIYVF
jgi:uncharacterized protein (TIGR00297 family)